MRSRRMNFAMAFVVISWCVVFAGFLSRAAFAQQPGRASLAPGQQKASGTEGVERASSTGSSGAANGVPVGDMDITCKPCSDFYRYANGGWLSKNPVPPEYPSWGKFNELQERNREILRQILEKAAAERTAPEGSEVQKIGDFYASCIDETQVEQQGVKPLRPELDRIEQIHDVPALQAEIARLQKDGVSAVFEFGSTQDAKNSTQVIGGAEQGGLGLPDRDYYTKSDDKSKQLRQQYVQHVTRMFELMGDDPAKAAAEADVTMRLETKLAEASMNRVDRRDPDKTYHKMDLAQLRSLTPSFSWDTYFQDLAAPPINAVDVAQPAFFAAVNKDLTAIPLSDWRIYLRWHLVHTAAPALSKRFVDENFSFYGHTLQGTEKLLPRWKRCVQSTDRELGFALGKIYVQEHFPPEAKAKALEMVHNLIAALHDDLKTLTWMGPETRRAALAKLEGFTPKLGYPDKWRDYTPFRVSRGPYVLNVLGGNVYEFNRDLAKIGKPVDRTEWDMTPPTVNAYYNAEKNEIVFPAGIMQPPFYDANRDDALNYGGMGAVIGHEMTHGFDDQGRKFDVQGNLKNWWTPEDLKNYNARATCVEKQLDNYVVMDNIHENGKLVLGESIADLGGLKLAYLAYEKSLAGKPRPEKIDGFTPEQRFFLGFGQIWAANDRPEFERMMVNLNAHPLDRFRAIAAPSNMPAFAEAFSCREGDPMVRPGRARCEIW
jgi:putative endopeptidase